MDFKTGDIILVPFPFTDLTAVKTRPALVIFGEVGDQDIIILPITSQKSGRKECLIDNGCLAEGTLPLVSYVRYGKITTLDISLVYKKVGVLKKDVLKKIIDLFKKQF